jgi:hypothetical protein
MGVLQFQVKGATSRLLQWQCSGMPGWVPGVGLIPRLWRDAEGALQPQSALPSLEAGQKRPFFLCGRSVTWTDLMNASNPKKVKAVECGNLANHIQLQAHWPYSTTAIGRRTESTHRVRLRPAKSGDQVIGSRHNWSQRPVGQSAPFRRQMRSSAAQPQPTTLQTKAPVCNMADVDRCGQVRPTAAQPQANHQTKTTG